MSQASFNVLTEPWIPVIDLEGTRKELGILSCLAMAHELKEIRDPSPMIEFGLYRLLVAFVLDCLILEGKRPEVTEDLQVLLQADKFDSKALEKYAADCGEVFDLFHPTRPFLQTPMEKAKSKPLSGLYPVTPSGTSAGHWHHQHEEDFSVCMEMAARLLTTIAPFMTAGGAGLSPSINGAPAIYALPVGNTLFSTLVLNLPLRNQDHGGGSVAWRTTSIPGDERSQATVVESLTWRPRRIQLIPNSGKGAKCSVSKIKFEKGDSTRFAWVDPNLAYRIEKEKVTPIRMRESRPLWRDAGPLALLGEAQHGNSENKVVFRRPDVVQESFGIHQSGQSLEIRVYGMRTDMKMKVFEWVRSAWRIPISLGRSTRLGFLVHHELERADRAEFSLRSNIRALYPREGAGNKAALGAIVDRCSRAYWQQLESRFQSMLHTFAALDPDTPDDPEHVASTAKNWRETIHSLATHQFELAAQDMDADSDALKRQAEARARLRATLRKVLS